jgi:DNA-binding LytR/AlgR family response regulator
MKIRCLLVDDEPLALEVLRSHLAHIPSLEIVGECGSAIEAFDFLQQHQVDLLFLDIRMPKLLGTDLIKALPYPPKVIFTTAHREYALDGFDLNAIDFLLKPVSLERLLQAVQKVLKSEQKAPAITETITQQTDRFLYFRVDRKMVKVLLNEIQYIESLKDYVRIVCPSQTVVTKQTISAVEEMLPVESFMRVHRSFIIAVSKVTSFTPHAIFMQKEEIPIGPLYRQEVSKRLNAREA